MGDLLPGFFQVGLVALALLAPPMILGEWRKDPHR